MGRVVIRVHHGDDPGTGPTREAPWRFRRGRPWAGWTAVSWWRAGQGLGRGCSAATGLHWVAGPQRVSVGGAGHRQCRSGLSSQICRPHQRREKSTRTDPKANVKPTTQRKTCNSECQGGSRLQLRLQLLKDGAETCLQLPGPQLRGEVVARVGPHRHTPATGLCEPRHTRESFRTLVSGGRATGRQSPVLTQRSHVPGRKHRI